MNIERISPVPPDKGKQKTSEKSDPDSESFKEMMKIGKAREVDLDEKGKRKPGISEEEETEEKPSATSSADIYYYEQQSKEPSPYESTDKPAEPQMQGKSSPQSPEFYANADKKKIDLDKEKQMGWIVDKELKSIKKEKISPPPVSKTKKKEEKIIPPKSELKKQSSTLYADKNDRFLKETELSEKAKEIKETPLYSAKQAEDKKKMWAPREKKSAKIHPAPETKKEEKPIEKKEPALPTKKEKHLTSKEEQIATPYQTLELPPAVQSQAEAITAKIESNLNPEIVPIIEHMIGSIIQFKNKGISETHIILNNPQFVNSRFYNSKITFEKYATAPNSYNITLTGSQEAVTIFNENIEGLYKKLLTADLDFTIGQLSAEYERPLFRRKTPLGGFDKDEKGR